MVSPLSIPHAWDLVSSGYLDYNLSDFEVFAQRALELTGVTAGHDVVDIAAGPGTLTTLAAERGARVAALDFSPRMLELLQQRLVAKNLNNVTATQGDGQALPYGDASFDAGFSMFGLLFFPDRARGFAELRRVLRPGAVAVVSSWMPMNDIRVLRLLFEGLFAAAPELDSGKEAPPPALSTPEALTDEMSAAGFEVKVAAVHHISVAPSLARFMEESRTSFAPVCLMEERLGSEHFDAVWAQAATYMAAELGDGPVEFPLRALLGVGTAV